MNSFRKQDSDLDRKCYLCFALYTAKQSFRHECKWFPVQFLCLSHLIPSTITTFMDCIILMGRKIWTSFLCCTNYTAMLSNLNISYSNKICHFRNRIQCLKHIHLLLKICNPWSSLKAHIVKAKQITVCSVSYVEIPDSPPIRCSVLLEGKVGHECNNYQYFFKQKNIPTVPSS